MRARLPAYLAALLCSACASSAGGAGEQASTWQLAYASESPTRRGLDIYVASVPDGKPRRVAGVAGRDDFSPAWSPNGRLIAYRSNPLRSDEGEIMVVAAGGGRPRNLTNSPAIADWSPAWSPDGRSLAFFSMRAGGRDVWVMRSDGSRKRRLTRDGSLNEYPTWSPDGRTIAFQSTRRGDFDIYAMASDGRRQRNLTRNPADDKWAAWSPDGKWIAFVSTRDGSDDVFVMRPDGSGARNLTRTPDLQESHPSWSPDGELTFPRHGETGPIELWAVGADGDNARRLNTLVEPVFVYDWAQASAVKLELRPAVDAIVAAARERQVVLVGEFHGWEAEHRFLRQLVADPTLRDVVDDIVVEFGNARFQPLVDAYMAGEAVTAAQVSRAWSETTQGSVWLDPVYAEFFAAVREQNQGVAPDRRLRVLLGDPPVGADGRPVSDLWVSQRDSHFAHVIQRDVISQNRRALVIAGVGHVVRQPPPAPSLANLLEGRVRCSADPAAVAAGINWCDDLEPYPPVDVHVVVPHTGSDERLDSVPRPGVAAIGGTWLAQLRQGGWTLGEAADSYLVLAPGS